MNLESLKKLDMAGKVAVITGSTQGLGETIAHFFADRGCSGMVITGRNAQRGAAVKAALEARGVKVSFVAADLADMTAVRTVMTTCERDHGRIDILVNSAAITDRGTIHDTSPELFDRMFATNVRAPFFLMQDALKLMIAKKTRGSIVNIISMSGHGGQSFLTAYSASKGTLITLTKNVAYSVMNHHIRVNGLTIGWMDTPGEDAIMRNYHNAEPGWLEKAEAGRPWGRLLKPAEVARAAAFLATEESGLMSGSIIDFDQQVLGSADTSADPPSL